MLRQAVKRNAKRQRIVKSKALPSPVEGWDAKSALASMKETAAVQLKNWFPQPGFVEVRKGCKYHAWDLGSSPKTVSAIDTGTDTFTSNSHGYADGTQVKFHAATTMPAGLSATRVYYIISTATNTFQVSRTAGGAAVDVTTGGSGTITVYKVDEPLVETLALWQGPASSKMFAAAGGAFWDVTTAGAGTFSRTAGGLSNRWQWCNHTTSAGAFLFLVNGSDAPLHYNGTTWTAPSITGITPADIVHVVSHKKRLWFTIKDSTKAAYLGTESVAGAATEFQFGGLFSRGGYLLACATWTRDGGAGADDLFVALSSRGQAAVYQGTDPSSANTWELVGVFDIPTPVGRRCFTRFGGDLLLITVEGLFPLSQLLAVDQSQVDRVAISDRISNAFNTAAIDYSANFGWECCVYPKGTRLLVNIPTAEDDTAKQYVMNTLTGAWCEFEGWDAITFAVFNDNLYFSGPEGDVYRADTGRADVDNPISATGQTAYSVLGTAQVKRFSMMRPLITATGSNRPSLGVSLDFVETSAMSALSASSAASDALWDSGIWDTAVWGGADVEISDWVNVVGLGTFGSIKFAASTGVDSGGSLWGVTQWTTGSVWGSSLWGSQATESETMRIQGFVILAEVGEYL